VSRIWKSRFISMRAVSISLLVVLKLKPAYLLGATHQVGAPVVIWILQLDVLNRKRDVEVIVLATLSGVGPPSPTQPLVRLVQQSLCR
jgi:hypothetical protein